MQNTAVYEPITFEEIVIIMIIISIGYRMNASAFRDLWAQVMFGKFPKLHEPKVNATENFKIPRATINHEIHEQAHTIFCLSYSQQ